MMIKTHVRWVDNLRFIACISVVMIHVIALWLENIVDLQISDSRWVLDNVIFQLLIRYAVPVFIMISGYLLLNPNKEIDIKKLKKYIYKMIGIIIVFGYVYSIIQCIYKEGNNHLLKLLYKSFFYMIQEKTFTHMWYVFMLIGLYIITPILRAFIKYSDADEKKFVLFFLIILSFGIPTINDLFNIQISTFKLGVPIISYISYYMLGYYIGNESIIKNKYIYFFGCLGIIGYVVLCFLRKKYDFEISNWNIFTCLYSVMIFKIFSSEIIDFGDSRIVRCISRYSLGIYLIHSFWLNLLYKGFHIYPDNFPIFIGEMVCLLYALIMSIISTYILSKLPYIKKLVI